MVARGLKRKLYDDVRDPAWKNQLQSVLNISINKYQHNQAFVQLSLLRSVLITNTLRQAQTHMEAISGIEKNVKRIPTPHPSGSIQQEFATSSGFEDIGDDSVEDRALSTAITAILRNLDTALDGSSASSGPHRTPLASVGNLVDDRTCTRNPKPSLSNHLQDRVLDDLLDFDTSLCEIEIKDHAFDLSDNDFMKYLPHMHFLGNEVWF